MSYEELTALQYGRSKSFADAQTEAMAAYCQAEHDLKQLQAENAKLRELLAELYESARLEHPSAFERTYGDRLRELGVDA